MSQGRVDRAREFAPDGDNPFGDALQTAQVFGGIAFVGSAVGDDGKAFAERDGKGLKGKVHGRSQVRRQKGKTVEPVRVAASIASPWSNTKGTMPPPDPIHEPPARAVLIVDDDVDVLRHTTYN